MNKIRDYIYNFEALWEERGKCHIRIYKDATNTVIICTELPDNKSGSITTIAEWLATEVWQKEGRPEPFVWIEHYPAELAPGGTETFHRVSFVQVPNARFFSPQWEVMTREAVERLIGQIIA
jgi:hypothetical protein